MKKFTIALVSVLILAVSLFSFTACGTDITALETRIAQLEQELADTKGEKGDIGPQGPVGPAGPVGPQGPQGESGAEEFRIYKMGETFTYVNAGIELFSIKVELDPDIPNEYLQVTIKNINMLGYAPNSFVNIRMQGSVDKLYYTRTFSTIVLPIGDESITNPSYVNTILYFGFPTDTNKAMLPYAIFTTV